MAAGQTNSSQVVRLDGSMLGWELIGGLELIRTIVLMQLETFVLSGDKNGWALLEEVHFIICFYTWESWLAGNVQSS